MDHIHTHTMCAHTFADCCVNVLTRQIAMPEIVVERTHLHTLTHTRWLECAHTHVFSPRSVRIKSQRHRAQLLAVFPIYTKSLQSAIRTPHLCRCCCAALLCSPYDPCSCHHMLQVFAWVCVCVYALYIFNNTQWQMAPPLSYNRCKSERDTSMLHNTETRSLSKRSHMRSAICQINIYTR